MQGHFVLVDACFLDDSTPVLFEFFYVESGTDAVFRVALIVDGAKLSCGGRCFSQDVVVGGVRVGVPVVDGQRTDENAENDAGDETEVS